MEGDKRDSVRAFCLLMCYIRHMFVCASTYAGVQYVFMHVRGAGWVLSTDGEHISGTVCSPQTEEEKRKRPLSVRPIGLQSDHLAPELHIGSLGISKT